MKIHRLPLLLIFSLVCLFMEPAWSPAWVRVDIIGRIPLLRQVMSSTYGTSKHIVF
jgi:hypothetical protein